MKNDKIVFFDSTLRDGSHAIKHQIKKEWISSYCKIVDEAGLYVVIVGHGNGLGASSIQVGLSLLSEREALESARENLKRTKLGAFMLPGFGTIEDNLQPALQIGVDIVCLACHCTEADTTRQHIEFVRNQGKEAVGVLMSYHMTTTKRLVEEAQKMESYGANKLLVMDSAGASTPDMVRETITALTGSLSIPVGFHGHNNLGLAVSNSLLAIECGAGFIDGTIRGFGAGAGNCPIEQLVALRQKMGIKNGPELYPLLDAGDQVVEQMAGRPYGVSSISVISGMSGVFSGFASHVKNAADIFHIDPRDIFVELGKRKVVAGQEDMIIDVALNLSERKKKDDSSYILESLL